MSSRKEQKEQLRKEREERETRDREAAARKARMTRIGGALALLLVAGAIIAIVALSGGDDKGDPATAQKGLQETQGPWPPLVEGLRDREEALDLPGLSESIYHVHAQVKIFVNGKQQTVPNNIGIDPGGDFLSSLHSHDEKGIIHMEAVEKYPFTLGQFMTVWGVKFTPTQLGAYRVGQGLVLETYLNGKKVPNGPDTVLKQSDRVVVIFGKPNSAPKDFELDPGAAS
jgi:hypothetical protein